MITWFLICGTYAQTEPEYKDLIILKNGSQIYGELIDYQAGESVVVKLKNGSVLSFGEDFVTRVEVYAGKEKHKTEYSFKTHEVYHGFNVNTMPGGNKYQDYPTLGFGMQYSAGYSFSNFAIVGAGLGIDYYDYGFDEIFFPFFIDFSAFIRKKPNSPFARFQLGYSTVYSKNENLIDKAGGFMMSPSFGLKFQGKYGINYLFDIGLKYQGAKFTFSDQWWWNSAVVNRDIKLIRTTLRFGILF